MMNKKTKVPLIKLYSAEPPEPRLHARDHHSLRVCGCKNKLRILLAWNGAIPYLPKDEVNKTK